MHPMFREFTGYNCPEKAKHRKRSQSSLLKEVLDVQSTALMETTHEPWINDHNWVGVQEAVMPLSKSLHKYATYLDKKNKEVSENHSLATPVRDASASEKMVVLPCSNTCHSLQRSTSSPVPNRKLHSSLFE